MSNDTEKFSNDVADIRLGIGLIKRDVEYINQVNEKLTSNLEKIQEMSFSVSQIIAMHESKLDSQAKIDKELYQLIEIRRTELLSDMKELNNKLASTTKELTDKIEKTEERIMHEIKALRHDLTSKEMPKTENSITDKLMNLEMIKHMIIGGAIVIGLILSKASIMEVLSLLS